MGIHINGDYNQVNVVHGDVIYGGSYGEPPPKPPIGFFGLAFLLMLVIWLIVKFWWVMLIVASLGVIAYGTRLELEKKRLVELEAQRQREALAARAENQNSAYLQGDPWGTYGQYPPPPEVAP